MGHLVRVHGGFNEFFVDPLSQIEGPPSTLFYFKPFALQRVLSAPRSNLHARGFIAERLQWFAGIDLGLLGMGIGGSFDEFCTHLHLDHLVAWRVLWLHALW